LTAAASNSDNMDMSEVNTNDDSIREV